MRIRHLGIVVQDLEKTAEFYENVLGFKRLGDARTPGHYPGKALDLSDGEVNYSLLQPNPEIVRSDWTYGAMGPNHIGVTIEDTGAVVRRSRTGASMCTARRRQTRPGSSSSATQTVSRSTSPRRSVAGSSEEHEALSRFAWAGLWLAVTRLRNVPYRRRGWSAPSQASSCSRSRSPWPVRCRPTDSLPSAPTPRRSG